MLHLFHHRPSEIFEFENYIKKIKLVFFNDSMCLFKQNTNKTIKYNSFYFVYIILYTMGGYSGKKKHINAKVLQEFTR